VPPEKVREVVEATLHTKPPRATHWSLRTMAVAQKLAPSTIQKIWKAHNLQPHRTQTFKLSLDPQFVEKLTEVMALYVDPPEKALVLSVDEKSQIQALDRTQPLLPLREGMPERQTHDYKRNGTTTLFTAFNTLDGKVTGACFQQHRHEEFLEFLEILDQQTPAELELHLILDNYGTHKHRNVKAWLATHPRFHFHFTPTSCSWANLVERWFAAITTQRIRRGTFRSVAELEAAIYDYIEHYNTEPKPYIWTATLERIVRKINRVYGDS